MFTFSDNNSIFILDGYLLETITNSDFNVSHSNPQDQKLIYEFGKEVNFKIRQKGPKINRYKSLINLLDSPAIMVSESSTKFLSPDSNELCDRINFLLNEKQIGNYSDTIE